MNIKTERFIKENWGHLSIGDICKELSLPLYQVLEMAYELNLAKTKTPDIQRRWTEDEDNFLKTYSMKIGIPEACNLLYRSRYGTYQRVKMLNLSQMIGK